MERRPTREEVLADLARLGISGNEVYLVDLIPLIEMIWADGMRQRAEEGLLEAFAAQHVRRVNTVAGYRLLRAEDARRFVKRFLDRRPASELLVALRRTVAPVRLSSSDVELNRTVRESLLRTCLDIASAAVTRYPYGLDERFNPAEKTTFFEILESLES